MAAAFLEPQKYRGTVIPVYDETLTCDQLVEVFTQVTGIKARREAWLTDVLFAYCCGSCFGPSAAPVMDPP